MKPDPKAKPLPLVLSPDERLTTACVPVPVEDIASLRPLIDQMFATMYSNGGIGLAANQVGLTHRILVADVRRRKPRVFINPEITDTKGGTKMVPEGCLSFPGKTIRVRRAKKVFITALDERGKTVRGWASGLLAICLQHELDHLDGITFEQRVKMPR